MKRPRSAVVWWCVLAPFAALSCGPSPRVNTASSEPEDYWLGGQTGSLIPDCDVAPLSSQGQGVPAGDALAVLYAGDCPDAVAAGQITVTGPGDRPIGVTLEPLHGPENAYLVRADQVLEGGSYDVVLSEREARVLSVSGDVATLPEQVGRLTFVPGGHACGEVSSFELELAPQALAHLPLMRWFVIVDGGEEQLWVDYGALELLGPELPGRARLKLPRCGASRCLETGTHRLRLRGDVAGASVASESLEVSFDVACGEQMLTAAEPARCSAAAHVSPGATAARTGFIAVLLLGLTSLTRRARQRG